MRRQRRTLGMVLVWLALTLVAIGPPVVHPAKRASRPVAAPVADGPGVATGSLAPLAADVRHSIGSKLVTRLNAENDGLSKRRMSSGVKVVTGSLASLAADVRHSAGSILVKWLNAENDGLNEPRTTTRVKVVTGSLAPLMADVRHSTGAELALRLNAANDGLNAGDDEWAALLPSAAAQRKRPADIERPTWIGLVAFAHWLACEAVQDVESREGRAEALGFAASSQKLAASGWSGCAAFSSGADEWGRSVERTVRDVDQERRPWVARLTASLFWLPDELTPALGRVGDACSPWAGILPRLPLIKPAGELGPQRRWARFNVDRTSGL